MVASGLSVPDDVAGGSMTFHGGACASVAHYVRQDCSAARNLVDGVRRIEGEETPSATMPAELIVRSRVW
jgi:hypothetical protein